MQFFSGINRNVALLAVCQALMMTTTSAIIASAALIGHALAEDKALATLPVAFQFVATMLTSIPASLYMRRVGRRWGFVTGATIGAAGAAIATAAIAVSSFWLFALGALFVAVTLFLPKGIVGTVAGLGRTLPKTRTKPPLAAAPEAAE